jgi:hypothetical protein
MWVVVARNPSAQTGSDERRGHTLDEGASQCEAGQVLERCSHVRHRQ